ncbi:hypothetical protein Peur_007969 [Populus x canadensis]
MVGFALLYAHGAFRVPDDLFLDDQEPANAGFLSFLGGDASSAAAPAGVAHKWTLLISLIPMGKMSMNRTSSHHSNLRVNLMFRSLAESKEGYAYETRAFILHKIHRRWQKMIR